MSSRLRALDRKVRQKQAKGAAQRSVVVHDEMWQSIKKKMEQLEGAGVNVGILSNKGGDVVHEGSTLTVLEIAWIHEFGAPNANIPERSWFRRTFIEQQKKIEEFIYRLAKKLVTDMDFPEDQALDMLGSFVATQLKKTITTGPHIPPPLQPKTIERKGSTRPLVDTGQMVNSITWEVEK